MTSAFTIIWRSVTGMTNLLSWWIVTVATRCLLMFALPPITSMSSSNQTARYRRPVSTPGLSKVGLHDQIMVYHVIHRYNCYLVINKNVL